MDAGKDTRLWKFPKLSSLQVESVLLDLCLSTSLRVDSIASIRPAPSVTFLGYEPIAVNVSAIDCSYRERR